VRETCQADDSLGTIPKRAPHGKIRVGYFSADFREHPVASLLAELIETHDRSRFEVIAFSFGPEAPDEMRKRLARAFDRFLDVQGKSNLEIASLARSLSLDIAVDLGGYTHGNRANMFALRAAPLQVSYIGYLGTMGAGYMDYLIADPTIISPADQRHYSEKILYLPSYQANDSKRRIADHVFTRKELDLPGTGFVFCCFNTTYKITPATFAGWMRISTSVEGSVLLLYADTAAVVSNLRNEARRSGVDADRLVFGKRLPIPEYRARYRAADLFLDTLPYNAGTTASDALWTGLPVLTCVGKTFAGRVAASLLQAIQVPDLITYTQERYEELAIELATHPQRLVEIKKRLADNRLTKPLFDTSLFTKHLEAGYTSIHARYQANLPPDHIHVGSD
jgi:predicted O-linked N-acetylglucosamine transferase (SPINDLY family)